MTVKRRRGGSSRYWTKRRIATAFACTAAVAATVGGLYALYRKRKSLKAVMKPRVQKLTPEQRETFVKESHKRKLPGKTADEVVERADEAVREARRAAATRRRRQAKRGRTKKRSSSGIVLRVLAAFVVAGGVVVWRRREAEKEKARKEARKRTVKTARKPNVIEYQEAVKCAQHAINNLLQKKVCKTEQLKIISDGRTGDWSDTEIVNWFRIYSTEYSATSLDSPELEVSWDEQNCVGFLINIKAHWTCVLKWNTKWYHIDSKCEQTKDLGNCGSENCNKCTFMDLTSQPHIKDITDEICNFKTPIDFASKFAKKVVDNPILFKLIKVFRILKSGCPPAPPI